MTCLRFDSTAITFDSTIYTFDAVCIRTGAINFNGSGEFIPSAILIAGGYCYLDGEGTVNFLPQESVPGSVDIGGTGSVTFLGGQVKDSTLLFSGSGMIRFHPGKYIAGELILNGEGNLEFHRTTELIIRESPIDVWAEYEFVKVSAITSFIEFDKNTVTLSKVLESIIK